MKSLTTQHDGQELIRFRVYQGEHPIASHVFQLKEYLYEVAFTCAISTCLAVAADLASACVQYCTVERKLVLRSIYAIVEKVSAVPLRESVQTLGLALETHDTEKAERLFANIKAASLTGDTIKAVELPGLTQGTTVRTMDTPPFTGGQGQAQSLR